MFRYWLPVLLLCAAIFIQSSYPSPDRLDVFSHADKLLHAAVYGILAALVYRALNGGRRRHGRPSWLFWASMVAAIVYGLSDEWHQSFVVERHADAADLLADAVGSLAGSAVCHWRWWHRKAHGKLD